MLEGVSGLTSPTLSAQAGPRRAGCPRPCPDGFWISPGNTVDNLSSQPVPAVTHPHSSGFFPYV